MKIVLLQKISFLIKKYVIPIFALPRSTGVENKYKDRSFKTPDYLTELYFFILRIFPRIPHTIHPVGCFFRLSLAAFSGGIFGSVRRLNLRTPLKIPHEFAAKRRIKKKKKYPMDITTN